MSGGTLGILYAADDGYAPFLGVSMLSLLDNSRNTERFRIYAVLDNVSGENRDRLRCIADSFGRELVIVDAGPLNRQLEELGVPTYRGNYATNYRLFFDRIIGRDVDRLLYLDCDTLVMRDACGFAAGIPQGIPAAAVLDSLGRKYKQLIGFPPDVPYFNAGVLAIDTAEWRRQHVTEDLLAHVRDVRAAYCNPDQDLLNIVLRGRVSIAGPEYNFQPVHRAYSDAAYREVYGFEDYYTPAQIEHAHAHPVILHAYRFLGQFPWHRDSLHPDTELFDSYLARSPWKDYRKQDSKCRSLPFRTERLLYRILPETAFLRLFSFMQDRSFRRQEAELLRGRSGSSIR